MRLRGGSLSQEKNMPYAKMSHFKIYYESHGTKDPLIMIMGLGGNSCWWGDMLIGEISKFSQAIIFDNRGTGRSEDPDEEFTVKTLADDVSGLMDALNIPKANILGISLGGMIAQEFVLNYPQRVGKLILCSTNCGVVKSVPPSPEVISVLIKPREGRPEEDIIKDSIPFLFSDDFVQKNPESVDAMIKNVLKYPTSPKAFQRQLNALMTFDSYERLNTILKPTLVMHGKKDILVPPQNSEIIAGRIPHARLELFDESAHALFSQETAPVVNALADFLKK